MHLCFTTKNCFKIQDNVVDKERGERLELEEITKGFFRFIVEDGQQNYTKLKNTA